MEMVKIYFAPMEGITGVHFRRIAQKHFPYVDKYYAPFIQPNQKRVFVPKEKRDILPENNDGIPLVPQVLTCAAEGFIRAGRALEDYGYREINLNLGCPSGTVVSKGKGAGMLADLEELERFFDEIFAYDWKADITVKTRLGLEEASDFRELLAVFRNYPIRELMVHARYRSDYYQGEPRMKEFLEAFHTFQGTQTMLCYNGNIFSKKDYERVMELCGEGDSVFDESMKPNCKKGMKMDQNSTECIQIGQGSELMSQELPKSEQGAENLPSGPKTEPLQLRQKPVSRSSGLHAVMIGRGLLANPALAREIRGGGILKKEELHAFHQDIFEMYAGMDLGEKNTLFKMKELWNYWGTIFADADQEVKRVRKADRYSEYVPAVEYLFRSCELTENRAYIP